ncbi:protein translocase subunit SecF [Pseudonocardia asaccharolytica]|uniref:Protein-export membrane protein SecF n=1 Tax=Pseudonocardia asaccharolytica DSM 44247 = NBRC 16224 TaxID=1123024 RepID=A0A511D2P3_9PSEU|nr:protein translocase subunit SecF [Pseudonocardia asaccharolytica]GEL19059.1 protein-export membrane protein SecF [Pseudonocardia asaccharolytica DSM 44247 = NBRC 16224]
MGASRTGTTTGTAKPGVFTRLYTGTGAFDIVGRRKTWYIGFGVLLLICVLSIALRGFNLGVDFTGGTQIQFPATGTAGTISVEQAEEAFRQTVGDDPASVQSVGSGAAESVIIRSEPLDEAQTLALRQTLFDAVQPLGPDGTPSENAISVTAVSGTWGGQITQQAAIALAVFLVLVTIFLALYFERPMAVAALVGLLHDVVVTAGIYSLVGFEVTPSTVIGLLTILGFSLYDTVVVFDKVKENTRSLLGLTRRTYPEAANLAVNQVLMRSINTSLIAVLPVVGLMVVGVGLLGVGTLADLALVQMVGILVGTASSVLLATPILVDLKMRDPRFREHAEKVRLRRRRTAAAPVGEGPDTADAATDVIDDGAPAAELRREQAVAAASGVPARPGKTETPRSGGSRAARPRGKTSRPTGKRRR